MGHPWFRMYAEAVDDDKLRLLAFEDRWHFVALLCLKAQGILDNPEHLDRRVAVKLGLAMRDADEVRHRLIDVGLIGEDWQPAKWDDRQFKSDTSRERTQAYRERIKNRHGDVTVTAQDTDTDTDTDKTNPPLPPLGEEKPAPKAKRKAVERLALPEWLEAETWEMWLRHRKTLSPDAHNLSIRTLTTLRAEGHDPRLVIEQSVAAGWSGLFPVKGNRRVVGSQTKHQRQMEVANEIRIRSQQSSPVPDGRAYSGGTTIDGSATPAD